MKKPKIVNPDKIPALIFDYFESVEVIAANMSDAEILHEAKHAIWNMENNKGLYDDFDAKEKAAAKRFVTNLNKKLNTSAI